MKAYCISDNTDTLMGMRLAGFEGIVLHERQEILDKLNQLIADCDCLNDNQSHGTGC